jgi:hypothetical protein
MDGEEEEEEVPFCLKQSTFAFMTTRAITFYLHDEQFEQSLLV